MRSIFFLSVFTLSVLISGKAYCNVPDVIRIPEARSTLDISHGYHKTLLQMALTEMNMPDRLLMEVPFISEQRVIAEIAKHDVVDIYWLGADKSLLNDLAAIPVPTTMGLIGFRKFIIKQDKTAVLDEITQLSQLEKLSACQGRYWPDTKILTQAGLQVTTSVFYEDLFKMLNADRCDYFPRGYHDHQKEVQLRKDQYPDFVSYDPILLHYPFAVFYYVSKNKPELAGQLENALRKLAANGDIRRLMLEHELTQHVFPLIQSPGTRLLSIENPLLHSDWDIKDDNLWLQPEDFGFNQGIVKPVQQQALPSPE